MKRPRPLRCGVCGSKDVVPIAYGLPGPDMMREADEGRIVLGGCCISDDDARELCNACGARRHDDGWRASERPPAEEERKP